MCTQPGAQGVAQSLSPYVFLPCCGNWVQLGVWECRGARLRRLCPGSGVPSSTQAWPCPGAGDSGHQDNTGQCPEEGSWVGVGLEVMCKEVLRQGSWAAWPGTACHPLRRGSKPCCHQHPLVKSPQPRRQVLALCLNYTVGLRQAIWVQPVRAQVGSAEGRAWPVCPLPLVHWSVCPSFLALSSFLS